MSITRKNRCVCLTKIIRKHNFDLTKLDVLREDMSEKIIKSVLGKKSPICMLPNSTDAEGADQIRTHLKSMHRSIRTAEDETGTQYCYLGFPFFEGRLGPGFYARAPLVLFPVSVYRHTKSAPAGWYVKPHDSEPLLNRTLFVAMRKIKGLQPGANFAEDFDELMSSRKEPDFDLAERLAELLNRHNIPVELDDGPDPGPDSDSDPDSDRAVPCRFIDRTRDELERIGGESLKITRHRIVGSFPQGESAIYQDYEHLIDTNSADEFIKSILDADSADPRSSSQDYGEIGDGPEIDKIQDRDFGMVLPSDSSQDAVVLKSQNSQVTLVRGPPGTGKSQVIVNIIANALHKNQTVLVVCQKRAALDVVWQRLAEKGLDKRAVLLDKQEDRAAMYKQLSVMLDYHPPAGLPDPVQASDEIDRLISSRAELTAALRDKSFGGVPVQRLYSMSVRTGKKGRLGLDSMIRSLTLPDLQSALQSISEMERNYKKFDTAPHPWFNRKPFSELAGTAESHIGDLLSEVQSSEDCAATRDPADQDRLINLTDLSSASTKQEADLRARLDAHTGDVSALLNKADKGGLSVRDDLDQIERRAAAGASLWDKFGTYDKIRRALDRGMTENTLPEQRKVVAALSAQPPSFLQKLRSETRKREAAKKEFLARLDNAELDLAELRRRLDDGLSMMLLSDDLGLSYDEIRDSIVLHDLSDQDRLLKGVGDVRSRMADLAACSKTSDEHSQSLRRLLQENGLDAALASDLDRLRQKASNGKSVWASVSDLSRFFKPGSDPLSEAVSDPKALQDRAAELLESLADFDDLRKHDSRKNDLNDLERDLLERCASNLEADDDWKRSIEQEAYEAWIEAAEARHTVLRRGFDDYADDSERLAYLIRNKSETVASKIIRGKGHAPNPRLQHELQKKRRIMTVRSLVKEFRDAIFGLAPCWLASPEIVSSIFPMKKGMFDMVIVDEASQLAAERAMPFLYRGERKVIAGDENQLKPHDLFQMQDDDDDDADEILSIESLLDMVKRQHPTHTLQWHYRSRWQELIDFSNHAFYNGQLHVAPNVSKHPPDPPIVWIDCEGAWENRANLVEAARVVDEIYKILRDAQQSGSETPTLGVIAFNVGQRDAILDEIETRQDKDEEFARLYSLAENPENEKRSDSIFIRNIENVQGDEREIIIFSVGYARDSDGDFRMQFGSLNRDGGENRLNVAVTRASKKIIVVCSIDPDDIKHTKNKGPQHLKRFLQYAKAVSKRDDDRVKQILSELNPALARRDAGDQQSGTVYFDSDFEEQVYDGLRRHGYQVDTQVGQSGYRIDLAIIDPESPDRYVLGVECDGAQYHSAKSVRERDVHRQKFLERRGWTIHRIWSRDWWQNPEAEIEKIRAKIGRLAGGTP